ncbi:MAG: hypothetical protein IPK63_15280 [Candidatus Competibacteraceae bacterium]|nr:hypothetical protein [Candidatus Competibacteraceae bacterium]
MIEYYTNESAAHLLLSMTRIVEKPEDCEGLRKCLNKAVENVALERDKEIDKLKKIPIKTNKRVLYLSQLCLHIVEDDLSKKDVLYSVFCPTPDE